jgi:polyisoprenoid-binding protein YceI
MRAILVAAAGISISLWAGPPATGEGPIETMGVHNGNASFSVSTNTLGIEVKGKSDALEGRVEMHRTTGGLMLDKINAWLPVKTLNTGMNLRDGHMRKYVFDTPNGGSPDLRFEAEGASCAGVTPGREVECKVEGTLAIRGVPRNFAVALKLRQEGSTEAFHIRGDGSVKLSDYGIEQPSQLGVKTANEVQIHLDFNAKPTVSPTTQAGVVR